jgi:hypothetical protein
MIFVIFLLKDKLLTQTNVNFWIDYVFPLKIRTAKKIMSHFGRGVYVGMTVVCKRANRVPCTACSCWDSAVARIVGRGC